MVWSCGRPIDLKFTGDELLCNINKGMIGHLEDSKATCLRQSQNAFELIEAFPDTDFQYHSVPSDIHSSDIPTTSTSTSGGTATTDCNFSSDGEGSGHCNHDLYDQCPVDDSQSATNYNRPRWPGRADFLLTLVGYTIGLGNVWKFPSLCQKNGGASFLIPYFIMLVAEGIPLYYMELCIGQRLRKGSTGVWHAVSPYLDGVGCASAVVCFLVCLYYNVILSWCLIYFVNSFKNPLPWSECPKAIVQRGNTSLRESVPECAASSPTNYFWYRSTLEISSSIEDGGGINWTVCFSLLVVWILCWLCMIRGIKSTGKVVYVTAILPLIILAIMFFRGVHLKGFQDGLALLFVPDFARLKDPNVWFEAASQTFFSLGVAYGSLICFASYNSLKNDTTKDAILICLIDAGVSIYASVVIFCFIGFRAEIMMDNCQDGQKRSILTLLNRSNEMYGTHYSYYNYQYEEMDTVWLMTNFSRTINVTVPTCNKDEFLKQTKAGHGLAFVTFTEAINYMPNAQLWSIMWFLMLITLGIDTQFGMLEGVITPIRDAKWFPNLRIEVLTGIVCLVLYILGFSMVQHSGNYWFQLIDTYCSGIPLLVIALVECLAVSYIYGMPRFCEDIEYMTNKRPRVIWMWCWKVISPLLIVVILVFSIWGLSKGTASYNVWDKDKAEVKQVPLPPWAVFIGVMLTLVSVMFIPLIAFLRYFRLIDPNNGRLKFLFSKKRGYGESIENKVYYHKPKVSFIEGSKSEINGSGHTV